MTRKIRAVFTWLFVAVLPFAASAPSRAQTLDGVLGARLAQAVDAHRRILLLLNDADKLPSAQKQRRVYVARKIWGEREELLAAIGADLEKDFRKAADSGFQTAPEAISQFVRYASGDASLHDADRLAFQDLTSELLALAQEDTSGKAKDLQRSLTELDQQLRSIEEAYRTELRRVYAALQTSGAPARREKWDEYIDFLKGLMKPDQILEMAQYQAEPWEQMELKTTAAPSSIEIYGYDFPAKCLFLTFDDGPHRKFTPQILEMLKQRGIKAGFFQVGERLGEIDAKGNAKLYTTEAIDASILAAGHVLGNHSYSHPFLPKLSDEKRKAEIDSTNQLLTKVLGSKPVLFRPPYGAKNKALLAEIEADGMKSVMWNIDSLDWAKQFPEEITQEVLKQLEHTKRGIVLFHDIHGHTVEALPTILDELTKQGYTFLAYEDGKFVVPAAAAASQPTPTPKDTKLTSSSLKTP
jgi:peptidoglycan/xylan/chitin deacetylase (PgdA/CDA1 family)